MILGEMNVRIRASLCAVLIATTVRPSFAQTPDNSILARVAAEDVAFRSGGKVEGTDEDRIKIVFQQIAAAALITPRDKAHAALVLQHSPLEFRGEELVATNPHNYLLAHYLAKEAYEAGLESARHLVAQTIDRYLAFTTGMQKYGTQRLVNQTTGQEELVPIDRSVPDTERAKYGVLPLADLLKRFPERAMRSKSIARPPY